MHDNKQRLIIETAPTGAPEQNLAGPKSMGWVCHYTATASLVTNAALMAKAYRLVAPETKT